ncbi:MAG: hypothetical protein KAW92_12000 [Candidatus Cloacimonetes bacterium]|nr:hypothetical protein [Candidatus Cloacimonadota bacterium]
MLAYEFETKLEDEHLNLPKNILHKIGKNEILKIIIFKKEEYTHQFEAQKIAKQKLLKLKGKVNWDGNLEEMREGRLWSL